MPQASIHYAACRFGAHRAFSLVNGVHFILGLGSELPAQTEPLALACNEELA